MIDIRSENLSSLGELSKLVPPGRNGKRTHLSTLIRWITRGVRSPDGRVVRLEALRIAGRWGSTPEALQRFFEELTPDFSKAELAKNTRKREEIESRASRAEQKLT